MNKIEMVKGSVGLVVSIGVNAIVNNVVKSTSDSNANALTKICITAGGFVLSMMVAKKAVDYTETEIDGVVNQFKEIVAQQV